MEWSIQEIARLTGSTSRTLRHYGDVGLLRPSRTAYGGQRFYDEQGLIRLQRILVLRQLGLGLSAIGEVLNGQCDTVEALQGHLDLLEQEQLRLARQVEAVRTTIRKIEAGEALMAEEVLDGFEHTRYEQEVTERWGQDAYERSDRWWRSLDAEQRSAVQREGEEVAAGFVRARQDGEPVDGTLVQELARRQVAWLSRFTQVSRGYVLQIGQMYVQDPRFGKNYAPDGADPTPWAQYVCDALAVYAERELEC